MLEYINFLSKKELKRLEAFINSPYHNKHSTVTSLFNYLKTKHKHVDTEVTDPRLISEKVYGDEKVNLTKVRKLISDFVLVIEDFFANEYFKNKKLDKLVNLTTFLEEHNFFGDGDVLKRYEILHNKAIELNESMPVKDYSYYYYNVHFYTISYYYSHYPQVRNYEALQKISDNLDYYFIYQKIYFFYHMRSADEHYLRETFDKKFRKEIEEYVYKNADSISKDHPLLYLEFLALQLEGFSDNAEKALWDYFQSLECIKEDEDKYSDLIRAFLYKLDFHYKVGCNRAIPGYEAKVFNFYKWLLEQNYLKYLISNEVLHHNVVYWILDMALIEKNFKWSHDFLEEYKDHFVRTEANDIYHSSKARIYFESQEYDDCLYHLTKIRSKKPYFMLISKLIIAKVYFETKRYRHAEQMLNSWGKYLKNNKKISESDKTEFAYILTLFKKLLEIILNPNKVTERAFLLRKKIGESKPSLARWVVETLVKIESGKF